MQSFRAKIAIIGVNPYVKLPSNILKTIQEKAQKTTSPIPVSGTINDKPFTQTLVKFKGIWRLYINGLMLKSSKTALGDIVTITVAYDPKERTVPIPKAFLAALEKNLQAKKAFDALAPYRRKEIVRYLSFLKTKETLQKNIEKTIRYLLGEKIQGVLYR